MSRARLVLPQANPASPVLPAMSSLPAGSWPALWSSADCKYSLPLFISFSNALVCVCVCVCVCMCVK